MQLRGESEWKVDLFPRVLVFYTNARSVWGVLIVLGERPQSAAFFVLRSGTFSWKQFKFWSATKIINVTSLLLTNQIQEGGGTKLLNYMVYLVHPDSISFQR